MKPLVATAAAEAEPGPRCATRARVRSARRRNTGRRSTITARRPRRHTPSRAQRWEEMPQHISDDILHTYATVGTYDTIADRLLSASAVVTDW
jgi:hypothetical protein